MISRVIIAFISINVKLWSIELKTYHASDAYEL